MDEKKEYDALYVGRPEEAKGFFDFLELAKRFPKKDFCVVGGPIDEKYFRHEVTFAGQRDPEDLAKYYNQSKVFLMPSKGESFCQTVVEALACNIPVISYNVIAEELYPPCYIIKID